MAGVIGRNLAVEGEAGAILTRLGFQESHGYQQMTRVLRNCLPNANARYGEGMNANPVPPRDLRRWERPGAVAVGAEAAILVAGALVLGFAWFRDGVDSAPTALVSLGFALALAAGLVALARGLWRGARWPRGAALTWQAIEAAIAFGSTGSRPWLIALLALPVPVALAGIFAAIARTQSATDTGS